MSAVTASPRAAWLSERLLLVTGTEAEVALGTPAGSSLALSMERFDAAEAAVAICRVPAGVPAGAAADVAIEVGDARISLNGGGPGGSAADLTTILRTRLAGLDAQTREELLRFIVGVAGKELHGPGGLKLAKRLALIRDVLRERLPYCTVREDEPLGLHVDEVHALDEQTYWFKGWVWDADAPLASLTLVSPEGFSVDVLEQAFRYRRRDIEKLYPHSDGYRPESGFLCCVHIDVPSRLPSGWIVQVRNVLGAGVEIDAPAVSRGLMGARDSIVRDFGAVEQCRQELIADHMRPALETLQRRIEQTATVERVEQFGTPPSDPDVSIVVPIYRPADALEQQLAHFGRDPEVAAADVVYVVDSQDVAKGLITKAAELQWLYGVPFRLVVLDERGGRIAKMCAGASLALAPDLVFLGPDVIPDAPGWLGAMLDFKAEQEGAGAVGPMLLYEDGSVQHAGITFDHASPQEVHLLERPDQQLWEPRYAFKGLPQTFPGVAEPRPVPALSSACLLVDRELFKSVGALRKLFLEEDFEAVDLCMRLSDAGYTNWYFPAARLRHLEGRSSPGVSLAATQYDVMLHSQLWGERMAPLAGG